MPNELDGGFAAIGNLRISLIMTAFMLRRVVILKVLSNLRFVKSADSLFVFLSDFWD